MGKKILCLDFDGVVHATYDGWRDGSIYGESTPEFWAWASEAKHYFKLVIYSSRSKTEDGRVAMWSWLKHEWGKWRHHGYGQDHPDPISYADFEFAHEKPPAFLTIDDRGLLFSGNWAHFYPPSLVSFQPWGVKRG